MFTDQTLKQPPTFSSSSSSSRRRAMTPHVGTGAAFVPVSAPRLTRVRGSSGHGCATAVSRVFVSSSSFTPAQVRCYGVAKLPDATATTTTSRTVPSMLVDPWSVSPAAIDTVAAQLFAFSLPPYLLFLYFLAKPEIDCPKLALFGFRFLLLFVGATIPAGIYAKVHYHDILANIDWLHGTAESLLTITNLLIVLGFRDVMVPKATQTSASKAKLNSFTVMPIIIISLLSLSFSAHMEPSNALSFPTWIIHISSLFEWLVAMGLVWNFASVSGNERWKSLAWGMIPLHTSGICACTYHLFYNAPSLNILVALQALLTCVGNTTMAYATYRVVDGQTAAVGLKRDAVDNRSNSSGSGSKADGSGLVGFEDLADALRGDSNGLFFGKVFLLSAIASGAVKYGSLYVNQPFEPSLGVALGIIIVPTVLNMMKWWSRSQSN